ncbi:MAG: hypothetical protein K2I42_06110 [Anaeroplasmataceae bacterium]|nr:hypothetical protein [Anaeroplasmataceae bacterium]
MILNKVRISFSIIGNFVDLLVNNEQRIKNMLLDYEIQTKVDTMPNGVEVKSLLFTNKNISIRFLPVRMDYVFNFTNPRNELDDIYQKALEFFKLFSEIFPDFGGNRIAILTEGFIENKNDQAIVSFADQMGFTKCFGDCNEISFKINTPIEKKESLNSVLNVNMGMAKNNKTQEEMRVLMVAIDVNTLMNHQTVRFFPSNFNLDFPELLEITKQRISEVEKYA